MLQLFGTVWDAWWHTLLNILVAINSVVNNPGVSIIIFTLLIRMLTVPLTLKSMRSTRNMQQIQPLIKEVQKKYAKDRAKQQEETMKIYHEYGVNPAAGCFPALVQIPVFIGLYTALRFTLDHGKDVALLSAILINPAWAQHAANFNAGFLWIHNLAQPDPLYIWPVLSAFFQFIQSRMSIPIRDPNQVQDSQTAMMQNMMQFMPIIILITSINFPAGTVVYWAMSSIFGAVQQYFITGFGSLATVPGLGFLPRKAVQPIGAPPPPPPAGAKKKGVMSYFMERALEAQEAQKASQNGVVETRAVDAGENDGASTVRVKKKGKGSEHQVKSVSTDTMKYASDLKYRGNLSENGHTQDGLTTPASTALPRKRRGKK
jgi:YidC/Oxa1 family membrane protein insertase